jgi:lysyl-tRNA synthetase class 2
MSWWHPHKFEEKIPHLEMRRKMMRALRGFFHMQNFWEVETSILQTSPCAEAHLHAFKTTLQNVDLTASRDLYLHTSPEFAMKKLLVAGASRIYQICHVFRNAEGSRLHSPEFTMIEWYRTDSNYNDLMDDCVELLRYIADNLKIQHFKYKDAISDPFIEWETISVNDAFKTYANIDLESLLYDRDGFEKAITEQGIRTSEGDSWDDLFFRVMAEKIEPFLGFGSPCILYDYPVCMAALSRKKESDPRFAERFELYVCGIELANAFTELTDPEEQRSRYHAELALKKELYGDEYPVDEDFLRALEYGMPDSAGIALGVDRLAMLSSGADDINMVLWAPVK